MLQPSVSDHSSNHLPLLSFADMCVCCPLLAVRKGPFRKDVSLGYFSRLFYLDHPDIVSNKRSRWIRFLQAERNGQLLSKPTAVPIWQPHKEYHPPIFGCLQASYADVEKEFRVMTEQNADKVFMFCAGDGLALMRGNHLLASKPDVYIDQTPMIIPIQGSALWGQSCVLCVRTQHIDLIPTQRVPSPFTGEHPHGTHHGLHCQWRLYRRFIMWCAKQLDNEQVVEDPNVSVFNSHRYFFLDVLPLRGDCDLT